MTKDEEGYQGWANAETWSVALHLDNEEAPYFYWLNAAKEARAHAKENPHDVWNEEQHAKFDLADRMKDEIVENMPEIKGLYQQLLQGALDDVDWHEVAEHYLGSLDE